MASYYYLVAQLPSLQPNLAPPLSTAQFRELSLRFLSKKDAAILEKLSLEPPIEYEKTGSVFLDNWYRFERELRVTLAQARASRLRWNVPESVKKAEVSDIGLVQAVRAATDFDDPLEAETYLDKLRFAAADRFMPQDYFTADAVFAYGIKLLLLERMAHFTVEEGKKEYTVLYNTILGESYDRK
ncbi:DUF2764 family protein [Treponema phagedenis]|uniref:DUF2764 family protein n=1 Tax=Treponema phagedenis TaxID=162 RepID=A0A0B7GUT4_TREPH|nr:DUF2764 family protein [Treponema phagedenis]EFW38444.1 hypothetical protein HMPREF9554_01083 [Treponema phagedenis F0421]NVP25549.1 DUF2764 family protein [Treponema phagedenis]QEJ94347.1 DUF2764 family protein [Treponema phagedenis]QEJ97349.1 DUF2764 family protein [Treponema phagedenis]QEK01735.1 DUF2764 family protein [Treponema phagedenis]